MAFGFISTYLGGILIQAIVNIFVYAPAIIVALYLYDRFIKIALIKELFSRQLSDCRQSGVWLLGQAPLCLQSEPPTIVSGYIYGYA